MTSRVLKLLEGFLHDRRPSLLQRGRLEVLEITEEGNELVSCRFGPDSGPTAVVVAGMHSDELTGVAAAVAIAERLAENTPPDQVFHIVPAVDVDGVAAHLKTLDERDLIPSLLGLAPHRDLEGTFDNGRFTETRAIGRWLDSLDRVDAFIDLHAANHLAPGGFSYLDGSNHNLVHTAACLLGAHMASHGIPRLAADPTGQSGEKICDGVFSIPAVEHSCVEFVRRRFDPAVIMVSELPVGLVEPHGPIGLEKLDAWKRSFQADDPPKKRRITPSVDCQPKLLADFVFDICDIVGTR